MTDRGYGFAWLAAHRFNCAQSEAMLSDVIERLRANPPLIELTASEADAIATPAYIGSQVHGAMTLVHRAPNDDEVFMPDEDAMAESDAEGMTPPGFASRPATIICTADDEADGAYCADWTKGGLIDDEGNAVFQSAPMFKHIKFDVTVAPEVATALTPPQFPRSIVNWIGRLFRRRGTRDAQ